MNIEIFTDGSCDDLRFGGFGVLVKKMKDGKVLDTMEYCEGFENITSTGMELSAVIYALEYIKSNALSHFPIDLYSDYVEVFNNLTERDNIKDKHLTTSNDSDFWNKILELSETLNIRFHWIKSHNGHEDNVKVDSLANLGRMRYILSLKEKVFVYTHQFLKTYKSPAEYQFNLLFNHERSKFQLLKNKGVFAVQKPDKNYYSLYVLKEMLDLTVKNITNIEYKKVIVFIDNAHFIKILSALKRGSFILEDQRYSYLWKDILNIVKKYDIEIHKNNIKRLETFEISEDKHFHYNEIVKKVA